MIAAHHQQAGGEDREDGLVELVAEPALEDVEDPDAQDRRGARFRAAIQQMSGMFTVFSFRWRQLPAVLVIAA